MDPGVNNHRTSVTSAIASPSRCAFVSCLHLSRGGTSEPESIEENNDASIYDVPPVPSYELPEIDDDETPTIPSRGILIMDNFSPYHGRYITQMALEAYGVAVISVLSPYITGYLHQERQLTEHLSQRSPSPTELPAWLRQVPFEIVAMICESDSGLESAEELGVSLGLYPERHDGVNKARRDKYWMNDVCGKFGLDVVRQRLCQTLEEAMEFAVTMNIPEETTGEAQEKVPRVIVKPTRGVASDNVFSATSLSQLHQQYKTIANSPIFGSTGTDVSSAQNASNGQRQPVLLQEFAYGTEYAIDIISKAGEHKVAAVWRYDKRAVNGRDFVYHATRLVDVTLHLQPPPTDHEVEETLVTYSREGYLAAQYAQRALDALDIRWGMTHNEVIINLEDETVPNARLVEVNCRQHNTDFCPLTSSTVGYNALDMLLAAYLGDEDGPEETAGLRLDWEALPVYPNTQGRFAAIIHLVCHARGTVVAIHGREELDGMESVLAMEIYPAFQIGEDVEPTVDIRTDAGWLHLMNDDQETFDADYARIMELMTTMFEVES